MKKPIGFTLNFQAQKCDDIVEYISKKPKEFVNCSEDNYSEQLFKTYNFSKPFDEMYEKYNNSETSSLNNC